MTVAKDAVSPLTDLILSVEKELAELETSTAEKKLQLQFVQKLPKTVEDFPNIKTNTYVFQKIGKFRSYVASNESIQKSLGSLTKTAIQLCSVHLTRFHLQSEKLFPFYIKAIKVASTNLEFRNDLDSILICGKGKLGDVFVHTYSAAGSLKRPSGEAELDSTSGRPTKVSGSDGRSWLQRSHSLQRGVAKLTKIGTRSIRTLFRDADRCRHRLSSKHRCRQINSRA